MEQHAGGGFVNVLGGGDELDAGVDEVAADVDVIEPVAGQPVDLVHDAIRDPVGRDVIQHPLQLGPLRQPCGLAGVDELGNHVGVEGVGFAAVRLPLRGDGEALIPAAGGGLFLGGDPLVGHRRHPPLTRDSQDLRVGGRRHGWWSSSSSRLQVRSGRGGGRRGAALARPAGPCLARPGARVRRSTAARSVWCVHASCPTGGHPTPEPTGTVGVVTVPENVRHRLFDRSRAGRWRVGWFTAGENFPSRATQPDGARSALPRRGPRHRGPTDGSLCRCAPCPRWNTLAVASTTTPGKGLVSSRSGMNAQITV